MIVLFRMENYLVCYKGWSYAISVRKYHIKYWCITSQDIIVSMLILYTVRGPDSRALVIFIICRQDLFKINFAAAVI